jgi:hypothetical protein
MARSSVGQPKISEGAVVLLIDDAARSARMPLMMHCIHRQKWKHGVSQLYGGGVKWWQVLLAGERDDNDREEAWDGVARVGRRRR